MLDLNTNTGWESFYYAMISGSVISRFTLRVRTYIYCHDTIDHPYVGLLKHTINNLRIRQMRCLSQS